MTFTAEVYVFFFPPVCPGDATQGPGVRITFNLQQSWNDPLFLFFLSVFKKKKKPEQCSGADGPGIQPVRSRQWWHYRWDHIPGRCQVELWWRRGKTTKRCTVPVNIKQLLPIEINHFVCMWYLDYLIFHIIHLNHTVLVELIIKYEVENLWLPPCGSPSLHHVSPHTSGISDAKPKRLTMLFTICTNSLEMFLIILSIILCLLTSFYGLSEVIHRQRQILYRCLHVSNVYLSSIRALILRDSVSQLPKLLCQPTNRSLTSLRSCSKSCRSQRGS